MRRKTRRPAGFFPARVFVSIVTMLAAVALPLSAGVPEMPGTPFSGETSWIGGYVFPRVEAAIVLAPIERTVEAAVIVHKITRPGFIETYMFDTLVYRFYGPGDGSLDGAVLGKRTIEGEWRLGAYDFRWSESGLELYRRELSGDIHLGTVRQEGRYAALMSGTRVVDEHALEGDRWSFGLPGRRGTLVVIRDPATGELVTESLVDGTTVLGGFYRLPDGRFRHREVSGELAYELPGMDMVLESVDGVIRTHYGDVEPHAEAYATGLHELVLHERYGTANSLILSQILGHDRRILPVLAWLRSRADLATVPDPANP